MIRTISAVFLVLLSIGQVSAAGPAIRKPVLFNTPQADRIVAELQVFPPDNPWNQDISKRPVPKSRNMIAPIGREQAACAQPRHGVRPGPGRPEATSRSRILIYPGESDKGPYPIPDKCAGRGLAAGTGRARRWPTCRRTSSGGDRPARDRRGPGATACSMSSTRGARTARRLEVRLRGDLRPEVEQAASRRLDFHRCGRTADLPGDHPLRRGRARHGGTRHAVHGEAHAPGLCLSGHAFRQPQDGPEFAADGRADSAAGATFDMPASRRTCQAILKGLKKYGMFVADNGLDWAISVAPDRASSRWAKRMRRVRARRSRSSRRAVRIACRPLTSTRPGRNCCRSNAWPGRNSWPGRPARARPTYGPPSH